MSHSFRISLKSVFLLENGEKLDPKGHTLISVDLFYPRDGVKLIENIKTLPLNPKDDEKKRPLKIKEEYLLVNEPFEDKILFRESIQGDSIIKITLGLVSSPKKIDAIVRKLVETGIVAVVGTLTGGIGITVTTAMVTKGIESIFESAKKEEEVIVLGIASRGISNRTEEGEFIFHLVTTDEIKYTIDRKIVDDQLIETVRTIPKGYGIAKVVLDIVKVPEEETKPVLALAEQ